MEHTMTTHHAESFARIPHPWAHLIGCRVAVLIKGGGLATGKFVAIGDDGSAYPDTIRLAGGATLSGVTSVDTLFQAAAWGMHSCWNYHLEGTMPRTVEVRGIMLCEW